MEGETILWYGVVLGIVTGMKNPRGWDPCLYGVGVQVGHLKSYLNPYLSHGLPGLAEILAEFETQPCTHHHHSTFGLAMGPNDSNIVWAPVSFFY